MLPPDLQKPFQRLLLSLTTWDTTKGRERTLACLRDYDVWDHRRTEDDPATCAEHLVQFQSKHGAEPYLRLLADLRDANQGFVEVLNQIDTLEADLRSREPPRPRVKWNKPPYRGLLTFDLKHAPIFFGRDHESKLLYEVIADPHNRFTLVLGASGSGKSSLVRAGLQPLIDKHHPKWLVTAMTPLELADPDTSLRAALMQTLKQHDLFEAKRECLAGLATDPLATIANLLGVERWLLIVDQFEELFGDKQGANFIDRLLSGNSVQFQVLATLRSDFFHHCLTHPPLSRAVMLPGAQFPVGPPNRLALERMVSGPIKEVELPETWTLDPALPPLIAVDAEGQSGGLALMAFALRELYELAKGNRLDVALYRSKQFGGLSGSIARRADATLAELGENAQQTLERVFTKLIRIHQHDDAPVRLRALGTTWDDDPQARALVDAFVKARLLLADTARTVEVAHEALLREWPTLVSWIDKRRDAFRLADRVRTEAREWVEDERHERPWNERIIAETRRTLREAGFLDQLQAEHPKIERLLLPEVDWIVAELSIAKTTHRRRHQIGVSLAELGDPRPGTGLTAIEVPDILWKQIPMGPRSEPFWMAAYPVTAVQFQAFRKLEAGRGRRGPPSESGTIAAASVARGSSEDAGLPNHPAVNVSWNDATEFCTWLSSQLKFKIRLPKEAEWEWAARSARPDFEYPWGPVWIDGRANTREAKLAEATAVGMYPQGDSLQGISDLAGNVWEWCAEDVKKEYRALRGGSWINLASFTRAAYFNHYLPGSRFYRIGFRVVCSAPIL